MFKERRLTSLQEVNQAKANGHLKTGSTSISSYSGLCRTISRLSNVSLFIAIQEQPLGQTRKPENSLLEKVVTTFSLHTETFLT
jgi:hypothetical protein